ncbi:MAG TPA: phosphoribosylaminoimidazolesuccinocarboxamide synthase [Campylobacterales bacterium]|nr:phosphoribosylaminoimidazolesuccinocarboxamide synthase [Campylobacterales bacterium]
MTKTELLYEGKGKKIFKTDDENVFIAEFKDDLTAFNALKKGSEDGKGALNCKISKELFDLLEANGIKTHMIKVLSDNEMAIKKVNIIPIEVVTRNIATGSLTKRLGIEDGKKLDFTLVEFYYKDDSLGDPIINDEHAMLMGLVDKKEDLETLKTMARKVNDVLFKFFDDRGLILVDFKLEFGKTANGEILLADEISPDSCRFWDKETLEKLDKDRFRQDLGSVRAGYEKVLEKILNK